MQEHRAGRRPYCRSPDARFGWNQTAGRVLILRWINRHRLREAAMKRIILAPAKSALAISALAMSLTATALMAQSRPSTVNRPCEASRQIVMARGAVVLGTGGHTYDRFVRDRSFCEFDEYIEPAWVPSRDAQACFVGYRCKSDSIWDD
jgi:hypothetical protein